MTSTALRPRSQALAAALLLALPVFAGAVHAQGVASDSVLRDFQRIDDYVLVVDGWPVPKAEIYRTERAAAFLILSSALPSPVLLSPGTQAVETVNIMKVAKQQDGSVDLLADATLAPQGQLSFEGNEVRFAVEGHKAALRPKPDLLGPKRSADLKTYSPATYDKGSKAYQPNQQAIAALKKASAPVTVRVFFGSWCPHCQHSLPGLIRVEDELKGSNIHFEYFGLPHERLTEVPEAKKVGVRGVPTGIIYVAGKETGRLSGEDWTAPEVSLNKILSRPAAPTPGK